MGQVTKEMMDSLTEFLVSEIQSKALDGITYTMVLKDPKDKELYDRYSAIRREVDKCGFSKSEIFRAYEVSNGYIFDMDLSVAKTITIKLAKAVANTNGAPIGDGDLIGNKPEKRRKSDMLGLAKYVQSEYNMGHSIIEVALFNKNTIPRIMMTGKDSQGNYVSIKYNAYAIRHWDIEVVNSKLLIPAGIRISRIEPFDILPSKNGVRFQMNLEGC